MCFDICNVTSLSVFTCGEAGRSISRLFPKVCSRGHRIRYTEAKVDVTQEIEQGAQWSAPAWAACCALCSISCVTSTLASVY